MFPPQKISNADRKLARLFRCKAVIIILTYLLGAACYADPFHSWQHVLSEPGTTLTQLGRFNLASEIIIIVGIFINGLLLLETAGISITSFSNNLLHFTQSKDSALMVFCERSCTVQHFLNPSALPHWA
jgi:hypothetical protein